MVEIKTVSKGAELVSAKCDGVEIIHDGIQFWNRHSPVLFPIVGKLKDGKALIENKFYEMSQHGFARDMEFEKLSENSYVLKYNDETLKKYPYKFELYISYEVNQNKVSTKYKVKNVDDKTIYFGLGGHPAFVCDYTNGGYEITFDKLEDDLEIYQLENGLLKNVKENNNKFLTDNKLILNKDIFDNDAIIMKGLKSDKVYLIKENKKELEFNFKDFKYLAVWSKPGANFICIEPWFNTADKLNSDGVFANKENIIKLTKGEEFTAEFSFEVKN